MYLDLQINLIQTENFLFTSQVRFIWTKRIETELQLYRIILWCTTVIIIKKEDCVIDMDTSSIPLRKASGKALHVSAIMIKATVCLGNTFL